MTLDKSKLLAAYPSISLKEMNDIQLMNRIDTKYVLPVESLETVLQLASRDYYVQEVDGERDILYHTVYMDTPDKSMYLAHQCGRTVREKIRVRTYVSSGLTFLEVKNKNNKGRTDKKRIRISSPYRLSSEGGTDFLYQYAWYELNQLSFQLENSFRRITLVNHAKTERLTIDSDICFHNLANGNKTSLNRLAVVELKRDGRTYSPIRETLHHLHVQPTGFSKYCVGSVLTDGSLKCNRFKPRVSKILSINNF